MDTPVYTLNLEKSGVTINKDIEDGGLLSLYYVNKAGKLGIGLFAKRNIFKDEEIIQATGPIVNDNAAMTLYWSYGIDILIQVGINYYVLPNNESRFMNHSCEPNVGFKKAGVFVAMTDIKKNDALTFDYSMCEIDDVWTMECQCKTTSCRKTITGLDIFNKNLNLVEKYKGYIPPFVSRELKRRSSSIPT